MAYITNEDIEDRLGAAVLVQLTDDDGDGESEAGVIDEAKLGAEGEVNSYLAQRFQVPIDLELHPELAGLLATLALDLVEYRLRARRPPIPADLMAKHDQVIDWLRAVARGSVQLPSAQPVAANPAAGMSVAVSGVERRLTEDELERY